MSTPFSERHIGPDEASIQRMLLTLKCSDLNELTDKAIPQHLRMHRKLDLPRALSEAEQLTQARQTSRQNKIFRSFIGLGYYGTFTPPVIQRNILENPGWYTAYTPYQAEISQGRMEALLNFQTMVCELTGLPVANASLLDEGTAAAEAAAMAFHSQSKNSVTKLFCDENIFPQNRDVLLGRMQPLGVDIEFGDITKTKIDSSRFAYLVQFPSGSGELRDATHLGEQIKNANSQFIVVADILSLCLLRGPGTWGADIVVGSTQRFGVPMGFGGPHAAYLAAREDYKRLLPGRIIGMSKDEKGRPALRLALQTREQHIRREKATSNICTAQVLLAVMASTYAVYHGPQGLRRIAMDVHLKTRRLAESLSLLGLAPVHKNYFDTLLLRTSQAIKIVQELAKKQINVYYDGQENIQISLDETVTDSEVQLIVETCAAVTNGKAKLIEPLTESEHALPKPLVRDEPCLQHPVFQRYRSETELLRYLFSLQNKDLALNRSMIPLGSCTMKLNAAAEMYPVTFPGFSLIHPFAPLDQVEGYKKVLRELSVWLAELTGFAEVSLQPNSGAQGELAGLLVIRKFHSAKGQGHRHVCLIPSSAHGTNPASAVLAGFQVVVVNCDANGNVDLADLKTKAEKYKDDLAALMITYPSTHGIFETTIREICDVIHTNGGQVYLDGANLNALIGIARPGDFGADVCHLNLHKTFCIPHGGGGPGVGPIGVASHLKNFLPRHVVQKNAGPDDGIHSVTSAPWGSAGILPISWSYIAMMGADGLKRATQVAILNANYIANRLQDHYSVLFRGQSGWVAHECIIDLRPFKTSAGVTADDVAKRLMDFGFHAPTMSWPVAGTLMIEPTESESLPEIDRFCEAMIAIREEIREIEDEIADANDNPLKRAPHCLDDVVDDNWDRKYSREKAAFPRDWVRQNKYWPQTSRIDNAFGDRNLVCTCQ